MSYQQQRIFVIHNGASMSDPAEVIAVTEIDQNGKVLCQMSDFTLLKELVTSIENRWDKRSKR